MQFRQKALAKLQSPEELDIPVRFARPQGWFVLAVTLVLMGAGVFWAVTGTVTPQFSAPGVLTHGEGSYVLQSPLAGQVSAVYVKEGDTLSSGAPVLSLLRDGKTQTVRLLASGRITQLAAKIGAVVTTGTDLADVERVNSPHDPLLAVLYASESDAPTIPSGASVDLTVQGIPAHPYGTLRGKIVSVGRAPQTSAQITSFLGESDLGDAFAAHGEPVPVVVELKRSAATKSGYAWSAGHGPPFPVESTMVVSGAVHLSSQHPADWILP